MAFFIGIDAGGTKTTAALADETRVLARAATGTIKMSTVGEVAAKETLQKLLTELADKADISLRGVSGVCLGLAGARVPRNVAWSTLALQLATGCEPIVVEDVKIALEAAFQGGPGVLVISGTGSHVMARDAHGRLAHAGGYGPLMSDEGSGAWIGIEAGRRALYEYDGETISPLMAEIMRDWQCDTVNMMIGKANSLPLQGHSTLVPLICSLARKGDTMAAAILADAGKELSNLIKIVLSRLGTNNLEVACTGSILENIPEVRQAMIAALPGITVLDTVIDPVEGALWLARQNTNNHHYTTHVSSGLEPPG